MTPEEKKIQKLHEQAMDIAEQAFFENRKNIKPIDVHRKAMDFSFKAKQEKNKEKVKKLYQEAFALEKTAAMMLLNKDNCQPTKSILFRSASWLAINSELYNDAIDMATLGLKDVKNSDMKKELKEVLKTAKAKLKL